MKKTLFYLAVLCLVIASGSAFAEQVLVNPGFEVGTDPSASPWINGYWGGSGEAITDPAIARSGNRCWRLNGGAGDFNSVVQENVPVNPLGGFTLNVSAWVKIPHAATTPVKVSLRMRFPNGAGISNWQTVSSGDWTQVTDVVLSTPAGQSVVSYRIYVDAQDTLGQPVVYPVWVDDAVADTSDVYNNITGKVTDTSTGLGLAGATVSGVVVGGFPQTTTTDGNGDYSLRVYQGTWSVTAQKGMYTPKPTPPQVVIVAGADVGGINFSLTPRPPVKLIEVIAKDLPTGALATWTNTGTLAGNFGNDGTAVSVGGYSDKKAVIFTGSNRMKATFTAPAAITGNGSYTVAGWICNKEIGGEETYVSWSKRGGPTGTNAQYIYGSNPAFGAVGHWGGPDMGFIGVPAAGVWHHLAVTFDGATEKVYVDGALNNTENKTLNIWADQPVWLACAFDGVNPTMQSTLAIATLAVYDDAWDDAKIAEFAANVPPFYKESTLSGIVTGSGPIYNACVQIGGYGGSGVVTGADGAYSFTGTPVGDVEVYADAIGYAPYITTVTIAEQADVTLDIPLTPKVETGVIVNGDFETEGDGGPSTAAGWTWWVDDPVGNDFLGNPWPPPNPDMYIGYRENANNQTPGGAWNCMNNTGVPHPTPGVTGIGTQGPQGACTGLTSTTMTDAAAAWAVGAYNGWTLTMTGAWDPTLKKSYKIASNDATTVTIAAGDMIADGFAAGDNYNIVRYNYWYWYTESVYQRGPVDPASKYNCYFKANWTHNLGQFDAIAIWVFKWENPPGSEIFGWVDPRSWIWFNSPGWRQYLYGMNFVGQSTAIPILRVAPAAGAVDWAIYYWYFGWDQRPNLVGTMLVDDVVVDRLAPPSIAELKTNPDGTAVGSTTVCTLAPRDLTSRVTNWLYVEDGTKTSGIRLEAATIIDNLKTGDLVKFTGTLGTKPTGERYIALSAAPSDEGDGNIPPVGVNTKTVQEDPKLVGIEVTVGGTIKAIAVDKSYFTVGDGYMKDGAEVLTRVEIYGLGGYKLDAFNVGDPVRVIGVVSKKTTTENVILYRDIVMPYYATGFEPEEGYALGPIDGQVGWWIGWDPKGQNANQTVSTAKVASGTQALKMLITDKWAEAWWATGVAIESPNPCLPNKPLKSLTCEFKLWRETLADNEFYWYPISRYIDYGNDALTSLVHALVNNTTPRTYGDPGWPEIGGAWVPVKIVDDFVADTRTVDYNGVVQGPFPIDAGATTGGTWFEIFYTSTNPGNGLPGTASYIDDLKISWVE